MRKSEGEREDNEPYTKILPIDKELAAPMIANIPRVEGEMRTIQKCCDCGHLFGRRFIPYGIGQGATYAPCLCQITGHRPSMTVIELRP